MANEITTELRGGALIVTFNRPDHGNALTETMANQLFQALKPVATDKAIRAVMLRGAGDHFMNGLDLGLYAKDLAAGIEKNNEILLPYHSAIRELYAMDKPVLAVVQGRAAGSGFSFALASDLVIAGRGARFNADFTSRAMSPDGGASFFLTRKIGAAKAGEILMLGDDIDADTAERLGFVNRVVGETELQAAALHMIDRLASGPTKAYGAVKRLVSRAYTQDINAQISLEHTYWGANSRSFDFRAAIRAYFAKQPAKYTGA
jgi:2-(1,2-epoxy-1,2-dihydrophenyl)acetyl-CoA isomerase